MKPVLYILLFVVLAFSGCKKEDSLADLVVGKWRLVSAYSSPGTVGTYQPVGGGNSYVVFKQDGSLGGNAFPGYVNYKVTQSTMTFTGASGSVTFGYSFPDNTLQLNQIGCIEGCGQRFNKVP